MGEWAMKRTGQFLEILVEGMRRGNFRRDFTKRRQDVGELYFLTECPRIGRLNHWAVRDRIAIGNADLAEV